MDGRGKREAGDDALMLWRQKKWGQSGLNSLISPESHLPRRSACARFVAEADPIYHHEAPVDFLLEYLGDHVRIGRMDTRRKPAHQLLFGAIAERSRLGLAWCARERLAAEAGAWR